MRVPALVAAALLAATTATSAATPVPKPAAQPAAPKRINVEQLTPKALMPTKNLHTEFVVEVNRLGQVARVRSGKSCDNPTFNAQTYGNALQAFIRTPDGKAIAGTYRLSYDYNVKTTRVRRDVAMLHAGGVNPNAEGAATSLMKVAARNHERGRTPPPGLFRSPAPAPSVNIQRMPDLPQVMTSPSP